MTGSETTLSTTSITSRRLNTDDAKEVFELYRRIAAHPGGLARAPEEVTIEYIEKVLQKTSQSGVGIGVVAGGKNLIGFILARKLGPRVFDHVLSDLAIGVAPEFQSKGIGRRLFLDFLEYVTSSRPDVLRIELVVRESNGRAISFYESIGFRREGSFERRILNGNGEFEADIPMGWLKSGN